MIASTAGSSTIASHRSGASAPTTRPTATQPARRTRDRLFSPDRDRLLSNARLAATTTVDRALLEHDERAREPGEQRLRHHDGMARPEPFTLQNEFYPLTR